MATKDTRRDRPALAVAPVPRQRRRGMAALGLALAGLGAGGGVLLQLATGQQESVVMVARDVSVGEQIAAADLVTTLVSVDGSVRVVPAGQINEVTGYLAGVELKKGMLLSPEAITRQMSPGTGQEIVPVAFKPEQMPARGLSPHDPVIVKSFQDPQTATGDGGRQDRLPDTPAVVDRVRPTGDGQVVVDLLVDGAAASQVSEHAAAGRIALRITSRRRR